MFVPDDRDTWALSKAIALEVEDSVISAAGPVVEVGKRTQPPVAPKVHSAGNKGSGTGPLSRTAALGDDGFRLVQAGLSD